MLYLVSALLVVVAAAGLLIAVVALLRGLRTLTGQLVRARAAVEAVELIDSRRSAGG